MGNREEFFSGKRVIVTGAVGSVGRSIVSRLLTLDVERIRVIDNNESGLFDMEQEYAGNDRVEFFMCDICDEREMMRVFAGTDLCFHAAALKHVPSCERSPFSAINVNIMGCEIVSRAALANDLERVLFTSSDKAVNPTNVMGTSKLMGERLFTSLNFMRGRSARTSFASTRFGNVLGSRGSVVPLFCRQIREGGPVTVTDERMTRFVMTIEEAAELVVSSMALARGGEVFVTKMPVLAIADLAQVMIDLVAPLYGRDPGSIEVRSIGPRPGEKLWEELSTDEERGRLLEGEEFLIVLPALATATDQEAYVYPGLETARRQLVYHSDREPRMSRQAIRELLLRPGVLPADVRPLLEHETA